MNDWLRGTQVVGVNWGKFAGGAGSLLSAFGNEQEAQPAGGASKAETERLQRQADEAKAAAQRSSTMMYVMFGLLGVGVLGTGIYFIARKKK